MVRPEILELAAAVGLCNWAFRFFPTRADLSSLKPDSLVARFLAGTGPAAIATLFVASALPMLRGADMAGQVTLAIGTAAVIGLFRLTHSVVIATLGGSAAYAIAFWAMGG